MLIYSQRDPRWANHPLGWGPADGTIGQYGCFDTVLAMIATDGGRAGFNPAELDEALTLRKMFMVDSTGTFDLLPDNALDRLFPGKFQTTYYSGFRGDLIDAAIPTSDTYAYVWISTASVPTHFVLMYSKGPNYQIADPWTGRVGTLAGYGGPGAVHKTGIVRALPEPVQFHAPIVVAPSPTPPVVVSTTPIPPPVPVPVPIPTPPPVPIVVPPKPIPAPAPIPLPTPPVAIKQEDFSLQGLLIFLINFWLKVTGRR